MTDKSIDAVNPTSASRKHAMSLAERRGFMGTDSEQRKNLIKWLEAYFSERTLASQEEQGYKDALAVADALYDHVNTKWLAECFKTNLRSLQAALGKDDFVKCKGDGCEELVPMRFWRVKKGYRPVKKHSSYWWEVSHHLCPDCKKISQDEIAEKLLEEQEKDDARREASAREHQEGQRRKRILTSQLPRREEENLEDFLASGNDLSLALRRASGMILIKPLEFAVSARLASGEWNTNFYHWTAEKMFVSGKIACEECYKPEGLGVFSRDMRDIYFTAFEYNEYGEVFDVYDLPGLRYLIAKGEEAFAESALKKWARGRVFGSPDFRVLCTECAISVKDDLLHYYKISP